jgi:hypothetical protein
MTRIDTYKHLDDDSKVEVELSLPEIEKRACAMNYGAHRLLSAMVHELRAKNAAYIERTRQEDAQRPENQRLNLGGDRLRSPMADAIEAALNAGHYY